MLDLPYLLDIGFEHIASWIITYTKKSTKTLGPRIMSSSKIQYIALGLIFASHPSISLKTSLTFKKLRCFAFDVSQVLSGYSWGGVPQCPIRTAV